MAKYRKKPVVIEAWKVQQLLNLAARDFWNLPGRIKEAYDKAEVVFAASSIHINTLEGTMIAERDDFVIQGVQNELYPCKPDIFEKTYEPVEEV
jgi:hypothetical protein